MSTTRHLRLVFLAVLLIALLSACAADGRPQGLHDTWFEGQQVRLQHGNSTLILDVDGIGPNGVMLRGIRPILKAGDPIIREVNPGNWVQFGEIESVDAQTASVKVYMYATGQVVSKPSWAE